MLLIFGNRILCSIVKRSMIERTVLTRIDRIATQGRTGPILSACEVAGANEVEVFVKLSAGYEQDVVNLSRAVKPLRPVFLPILIFLCPNHGFSRFRPRSSQVRATPRSPISCAVVIPSPLAQLGCKGSALGPWANN
jgi:hypothetical protein